MQWLASESGARLMDVNDPDWGYKGAFYSSGNTTVLDRQDVADYVTNAVASGNENVVYNQAQNLGMSGMQLDAIMGWESGTSNAWAESQGLPSFAVGTNYIPQDMVAQVHKGEMIVPAKYNPATSGIQVNEALLEEIKALRQEVSELKAQDRQIGVQLIKSTVKTADYIEKWDSTGLKTEAV
jgi:hypothetical protein